MDSYQTLLTIFLLFLFALTVKLEVRFLATGVFPFISFAGAYYFLFHGAISSYVAANVEHLPFPREISFETFAYSAAFASVVVAGIVVGLRLPFSALSRSDDSGSSQDKIRSASLLTALILMVIHFSFYAFPALSSLPSLPQLRTPSWNCAFAILSFWALSGRLRRVAIAGLVVILLIKLWLDIRLGLITPLVYTFTILAAASLVTKKLRVFVLSFLLVASIVLGYGYVKNYSNVVLRDQPWSLFQFSPEFTASNILSSFNAAARRSSHSLVTETVLSKTPEDVAEMWHNPLVDALRNHIPRFLWSGKPTEKLGNEFGRRYNILDNPNDNDTSWNLTWAVDLFIAYGMYLAVAASFAINVAIGVGVRWMSGRSEREVWFGIHAAVLFPLFYQESNFSVMTGNLLSIFAVIYLVHQASKIALKQLVKITQAST